MEKYLMEEYNVYEDKNWLTDESEIEDYFKDSGKDWLECGQGYCQDNADIICKIGDKFYNVVIKAEIVSEKQDMGDRLYWVDYISSVEYWKIEKPKPKEKTIMRYELNLTTEQKELLERYMTEIHIEF